MGKFVDRRSHTQYPDCEQLPMFRHQFQHKMLPDAQQSLQLEVRAQFQRVETLLELLFISPLLSCSFSSA